MVAIGTVVGTALSVVDLRYQKLTAICGALSWETEMNTMGMNEREMLLLAAKIGGIKIDDGLIGQDGFDAQGDIRLRDGTKWNPLSYSGDAFDLAAHIGMETTFYWSTNHAHCTAVETRFCLHTVKMACGVPHDRAHIARWAVVLLAVQLQQTKEKQHA